MDCLNVCFVGLGSIAKRHINNLYDISRAENVTLNIDCFRSSKRELPADVKKLIRNVYYSIKEVPTGYDAVFITNPTNMHISAISDFYKKSRSFFIEKPLCERGQNVLKLNKLLEDSNKLFYVACPLRYTNVIQYIKNNVDFSTAHSVRCISSSYLPDWRPGTDYRSTYSAHKDMGGGVSIDLIHEWDYIYYLLGKPNKVYSLIKKVSNLEIDSDDIALYIADYGDKTVELHLDYFGKKTIRQIEIFTDDDTILGDLTEGKIYYKYTGKTIDLSEKRNDYQKKELEHFLACVEGKAENTNDINKSLDVLKLTGGILE